MQPKTLFVSLSFILIFLACQQRQQEASGNLVPALPASTETSADATRTDTIEIEDLLARAPFLFKVWEISFDSLRAQLPGEITFVKSTRDSYHVGKEDTITLIRCGSSQLHHLQSPSVGCVEDATITDRAFLFQRHIRIGDAYEDVTAKLPTLPKTNTYFRKIYINSGGANSTLIFEFKDGKLASAIFWPYTG